MLSGNPNAIHLLDANRDKIDWHMLCRNPNAIELLKANPEQIADDKYISLWPGLSSNPGAIELLTANQDKIDWQYLSTNPMIFEKVFNRVNRINDYVQNKV